MASMRGVRVGVIGAGAIGGVVIDRLLNGAEARAEDLIACEPRDARREEVAQRFHVRTTTDLAEAAATDLIVLAVPPLEVAKVLRAIGERLGHRPLSFRLRRRCHLTSSKQRFLRRPLSYA